MKTKVTLSSAQSKQKRKRAQKLVRNLCAATAMDATPSNPLVLSSKLVWIWTENKQVMTNAVERGWNTFVFPSNRRDLANEWSCK